MLRKLSFCLVILTAGLLLMLASNPAQPVSGDPHPNQSQDVAIIGSPDCDNGGLLPTAGLPDGPFVFTNLAPAAVSAANLAPFDTAVLNVCSPEMFCSTGTLSASSKMDLVSFVSGGGKLIIYDSECPTADYGWLPFPFTTNNPGAQGAQGTLNIVEDNVLSHTDPNNPHHIDANTIATSTDAVGDMNVMTTRDPQWCLDMSGTNITPVTGPVHTYARSGAGLIIYNGLDIDDMFSGTVNSTGSGQLTKMWLQELQAPFNPSPQLDLPCGVPVIGPTNGLGGKGDNPWTEFAGGPVNVANGNEAYSHTDVIIPGRGVGLEFTRSYNSQDARNGPLGYGWTFSYDMRLGIDRADPNQTRVTRWSGAGGNAIFLENPDGSYSAPAGVYETLTENADQTFVLTTKAQVRYGFDATGKLTSIKDRNDNTTSLFYTGGGILTAVADPGGRFLTFGYDASNRIKTVTDPLGRRVEFAYDGDDLRFVTRVQAGGNLITEYGYDNHRLNSIRVQNEDSPWQNIYDSMSRVVEQIDRIGNSTCFFYGTGPAYTGPACPAPNPLPLVNQTIVRDPKGNTTTYTNDSERRTSEVKDHLGGIVRREFDASSNPTCVTDQRGKKTAYAYDSKGNVTQIIDAANTDPNCQLKSGGKAWTFTYNGKNDISSEIDPLLRFTDYVYDDEATPPGNGNLTRIVRKESAGGQIRALTCFEPNGAGLAEAIIESTDLNPGLPASPCIGNRTLFGYDNYGNQTCSVSSRFSLTTACASPTGAKKSFIYDLGGRLLFETNELTNEQRPPAGNPETGVGQCGTAGTGDGADNDGDFVADDGCGSMAYEYDGQNNVTKTTDGMGGVTTFVYNVKGALESVKDANRNVPAGAFPEAGGPACGTYLTGDGNDNDGDGVADDGCFSTRYFYDDADRLRIVVESAFRTGNPEVTVIPVTTYGYDKNGNRTSVTSPRAPILPAGANGPETFPQCGPTGFGNGVNEDAAADDTVADDGCPSSFNSYDALNRLATSTDPLGRVTSYQYDAASNVIQRTDPRPVVTNFRYDALNRMDCLWTGAATPECPVGSETYSFDDVSNRKSMVDPSGPTNYAYDALNRITCHGPNTIAGPCPSGNVGYTYDDLPGGLAADYPGQRTKMTYPDGKTVSYTYDEDGSMSTVTDWLSKQTVYDYDDAGRLTETQLPNGVFIYRKYDAADRLTCVLNDRTAAPPPSCTSGTAISRFEYTLIDAIGNRRQMVDLSGTHTYDYDALYRLKQVAYPGGPTDAYTYDANSNRKTKNTTTYTYDAADQMTWDGSKSYIYDPNGNQTARGSDTFTYDHENRLTKITLPNTVSPEEPCYDFNGSGYVDIFDLGELTGSRWGSQVGDPDYDAFYDLNNDGFIDNFDVIRVSNQYGQACTSRFTYNGDGLRTARAGSYLNWKYVWDVAAGLPVVLKETDSHQEVSGQGTDNTYVYGLDLISVTDRTGAQTYFMYDGLGSTANLTNGAGTTTATYSYDVFGALRSPPPPSKNEFRFTGEQQDRQGQREFYYLRARYYDPVTGRFLSQDPLPGGNLYAYAGNNPVGRADPTGKKWMDDKERPGSLVFRYKVCDIGKDVCLYLNELPFPVPCAGPRPEHTWLYCQIGGSSSGYLDFNFTFCVILCVTGGAQFDASGPHFYIGGGAGVGGGISYSVGPGEVSDGVSCGWSGSVGGLVGLAGQVGGDVEWEGESELFYQSGVSLGSPGFAGTCYYVLPAP